MRRPGECGHLARLADTLGRLFIDQRVRGVPAALTISGVRARARTDAAGAIRLQL